MQQVEKICNDVMNRVKITQNYNGVRLIVFLLMIYEL